MFGQNFVVYAFVDGLNSIRCTQCVVYTYKWMNEWM